MNHQGTDNHTKRGFHVGLVIQRGGGKSVTAQLE